MEEFRSRARRIVEDPTLTFHQRRHALAGLAEGALDYVPLGDEARQALELAIR